MIKSLLNIFRVPELRNKVLFTFFMLLIYRIGFWVPLPGVDQQAMQDIAKNQDDSSAAGRMASYVSIFSGGSLTQSTIFSLGIMPYISSSIIFQLADDGGSGAGEIAEGRGNRAGRRSRNGAGTRRFRCA